MLDMKDIFINIHRLEICQWAYGWSDEKLKYEIENMIIEKQWNHYFEQRAKEEQLIKDLMFEINSRQKFDINILKEEKTKSYGNKYIKRKYRY